MPGRIRVIGGHCPGKLCCLATKVLLINCSGFVDDKSHHARGTVLNRVGNEGESCAHLAIDDVVPGPARRVLSLASEDPEHIPIERNMLANLIRWKILARVSDEWVYRAIELIISTVPVETIMLAFVADQFLRELRGEI